MKKTFCDTCGEEIKGPQHLEGKIDRKSSAIFVVEITLAPAESDYCKYCIIDAVNKLDDRPQHETIEDLVSNLLACKQLLELTAPKHDRVVKAAIQNANDAIQDALAHPIARVHD
jgi:hypothetical protein